VVDAPSTAQEIAMAEIRELARFTITEREDGYWLRIEDDTGRTLELRASEEQLDMLIDELDSVLGEDVAGDEDYEAEPVR
jgi:hypothetical protein